MQSKYNISRTDLAIKNISNLKPLYSLDNISIYEKKNKYSCYHLITFPNLYSKAKIAKILKAELTFFINAANLPSNFHTLIIGLGNRSNTADSIGSKILEHININFAFKELNIVPKKKISAFEPGVLGTTGIATSRLIKSVTKEIKPDLVILIDAFVTDDFSLLNKSLEISNQGIVPGSGLSGHNQKITAKLLGAKIIVIGIPTAILVKAKNEPTLLVSAQDIDIYIQNISLLISQVLNEILA